MDHAQTISLKAHAKLNLALSVGPPIHKGHPDAGMHPICSWMHAINLYDELHIARLSDSENSKCSVRWADGSPAEWPAEQDLAFRAHKALESETKQRLPAHIQVSKRIPAGGGLGGGSADAAAVFVGLNTLFDLKLDEPSLHRISRSIGSDIAFFIDGSVNPGQPPRPAVVEGLGDRILRLPVCESLITLLLPGFGCATREVYAAFDHAPEPGLLESARVHRVAESGGLNPLALFNALTSPAQRAYPELASTLESFQSVFSEPVHLSGSGSTMFVIGHLEAAQLARAECQNDTVVCTHLV